MSTPRCWCWARTRRLTSGVPRHRDLGKQVVLIEAWPTLGGVSLNVGCIPSKALLHAAKVMDEKPRHGGPRYRVRRTDHRPGQAAATWKNGVVSQVAEQGELGGLAEQPKVTVIVGLRPVDLAEQGGGRGAGRVEDW